MEKLSKEYIRQSSEYPPPEFKNLSAEDILRWLEQTNRFLRKFLTAEEIMRSRKLQNEIPKN